MNNPAHRTFWVATGLATTLLALAGGIWVSNISHKNLIALLLGAAGTGILLVRLWRTHQQSSQLVSALRQLARGEAPLSEATEEGSGMYFVNMLHHRLREATDFIETVEGETPATAAFEYLRPDERLGKALLDLKSTLRIYREDEKKRHWSTQGIADFADILQGHSNNIEEFSDQVVRQLVKYVQVNQGGMFVKTEAEGKTWFELTACYAYDKKRHSQKRWAPGKGLVGQCALERKMILLNRVPDQYTTITSGLGEATPSCMIILPLCWNEEIYGVIELASFTELAGHQLDFLKKIAESIAASLATVQTNAHMQQLLQTSQQLAKESEQLSLVANNTDNSVVIANRQGQIEFVNQGFIRLTGYTADEVMGKKPGHVLQGPDTDPETVERIRQQLKGGNPFYEEILNYRKSGESYWISLVVNPIKNEAGEIEQYISIQADVTKIKRQTLDYTYKLAAISRSNAIVEFDPQGIILDANDLFLDIAGYEKEDLLRKDYQDLLPEADLESPQTQMMWDNLKAGTFFSGEFKQKSKAGEELWLSGTFNPIFDLENNLRRIMMFAQFTTYEKEKQNDLTHTVHAFAGAVQTFNMTPEGNLKKANALFLQRFGYQRREISRMKLADLLEADVQLPDIKAALQHQESLPYALTLVTKSGEKVLCQCSFAGIRSLEATLAKVVVVVLETTPKVLTSTNI